MIPSRGSTHGHGLDCGTDVDDDRGRRCVMRQTIIVEIRAAEGGDDAKDLVLEQRSIYRKLAGRREL